MTMQTLPLDKSAHLSNTPHPLATVKCLDCGSYHPRGKHGQVLADMPTDLAELSDDFLKMRLYPPESVELTHQLTLSQMKEALWRMKNDESPGMKCPEKTDESAIKIAENLCEEIIQQAGGLEAAIAAAFGSQGDDLISDTIRTGSYSRRKFLQQVAIVAAAIVLSNCSTQDTPETDIFTTSRLEKTNLKIGFLPITCATPIIMSVPLKFYEKYGLNVELVKMNSWSQVRDSAIAGELDAYHMLSPMPLAMTLGLDSTAFPMKLASIENINGQSITVAMKHQGKVNAPKDFKGFTIGIPFPYSMHNLLLRYYLATGNVNPDKDVKITIIPPPEGVAKMKAGELDAFLLPDGNAQQAVYENVGFIHLLTKDLWPGHPCCAFAASKQWIDQHPSTFRALNQALIDGCNYASNPANRRQIAQAIAAPEYLDQPVPVLEAVLTGKFEDGRGNRLNVPKRIDFDPYPWKSFSYWITSQFMRWGTIGAQNVNHEEIADEVFLTALARQLAKQLGQTPPTIILRNENLKFGTFDPTEPDAYLRAQIQQYGF